jgi:hypothetical protein
MLKIGWVCLYGSGKSSALCSTSNMFNHFEWSKPERKKLGSLGRGDEQRKNACRDFHQITSFIGERACGRSAITMHGWLLSRRDEFAQAHIALERVRQAMHRDCMSKHVQVQCVLMQQMFDRRSAIPKHGHRPRDCTRAPNSRKFPSYELCGNNHRPNRATCV